MVPDRPLGIRYGTYKLTVGVPGFSNSNMEVVIDQPGQVISVAMGLGSIEGETPSCSVKGRVVPESGAVRVRAMQVYGSRLWDVGVDQHGSFALQNLECGEYMLMVTRTKACLAVRYARFMHDTRIEIRVEPRALCGVGN